MKKISSLIKFVSILLILTAILVPVSSTSAALRICRTDPLVFFSDGHKLSITASISADASAVTQIVYTVHAPVGSQMSQLVHTAGGLGLEEVVVIVADQPAGVYMVDTVVYTRMPGVDVTATTKLLIGISNSASGHSFEHIITTINDPIAPNMLVTRSLKY